MSNRVKKSMEEKKYSWVETAISVFAFVNIDHYQIARNATKIYKHFDKDVFLKVRNLKRSSDELMTFASDDLRGLPNISFLILLGFMFMSFIECMTLTVDNRIIALSAAIGINVGVLIVFGFAVLLYLGIYQKKPALVLAYFIFGVVIDASLVSGLLAVHYGALDVDISETVREIYGFWREPVTHAVIVIFLVYTVVLAMTFRTWSLMTSRRSEDHRKLANYFPEPDME